MGCVKTITATTFPKQGEWVGKRVDVCFHYDSSQMVGGTIIRDDLESPGETLIHLDDGRYVRAVECHYSLPVD